ncbi:MAG: malate dehydrogenase [Gemmatimonadota bacterium]|nr:MAG: malate dehydrogenase [Gemmatimonadota bacterium]
MDIAVIGAGGSVGRQIAHMIVSERLLEKDERLILVGNPEGSSAKSVFGFAVDLTDAYADISPRIEVTLSPDEIQADLIVMACGATIPVSRKTDRISRDYLAESNHPVFERYASALARHGRGSEIVICISNPNELAVAVFAKHLGRNRVIGMGAFLDSLRFRKEIALDLGIRRQRIHGFMLGEHGFNMVPIWSGIHIYGFQEDDLQDTLGRIRKGYQTPHFHRDVAQASGTLKTLISEGKVQETYALVDEYPPDIRVALKPFVTHFSGSKTVTGTAKATMELIRTITMGNDAFISGQLSIEGEFHSIHSTIGVPFVIGNQGVERIVEISLADEEKELLLQSSRKVQEKIDAFL